MTVNLRQAFEDFCKYGGRKPSTIGRYAPVVHTHLKNWLETPLNEITPAMVEYRCEQLARNSSTHAKFTVQILRAVVVFARSFYNDTSLSIFAEPGTVSLTAHLTNRPGRIAPRSMPALFRALDRVTPAVKDWCLLLLLTRAPRIAITHLTWDAVDLERRLFFYTTIDGRAVAAPMTDMVYQLFDGRRQATHGPYVFPGRCGKAPMDETSRAYKNVCALSGIAFTAVDLTRTNIAVARELFIELRPVDVPRAEEPESAWLTFSDEVERAREQYQQIENEMLYQAGILEKDLRPVPLISTAIPCGVRDKCPTIREAWQAYLKLGTLKAKTRTSYILLFKRSFRDWLELPLSEVTKHMVIERHFQISNKNSKRGQGKADADGAFRLMRALYKFSMAYYDGPDGKPLVTSNPVDNLSPLRRWNRAERRSTLIRRDDLRAWFDALDSLTDDIMIADARQATYKARLSVVRDYLKFVLLTGCRGGEAKELKWEQVDLRGGFVTFIDTKNHKDHKLPLSDYLWRLLEGRRKETPSTYRFVFPGLDADRPLSDCRKTLAVISAASGVDFTGHDLRRTFASNAIQIGIEGYRLKCLLNHSAGGDVTQGYIRLEPEHLRPLMQKITDAILRHAGRGPGTDNGANVIPIGKYTYSGGMNHAES